MAWRRCPRQPNSRRGESVRLGEYTHRETLTITRSEAAATVPVTEQA
jgi:hypothetical protein